MAHETPDPNKPILRETHGKIVTLVGIPVGRHVEEKITFHARDPRTGQPGERISLQQYEIIQGLTGQGVSNFTVSPTGEIQFYDPTPQRLAGPGPGPPAPGPGQAIGGLKMAGFLGALGSFLPVVSDLLKPAIGQLSTKIYGSRAVTGYSQSERKRLVAGQGNITDMFPGLPGIGGASVRTIGPPPPPETTVPYLPGDPNFMRRGMHFSFRAGRWVKNRRMNPCNPKALRRSMRRVASFAKFAKSAITFTQRVKMKKRRRR